MNEAETLLSVKQAAAALGVTRKNMYMLGETGAIDFVIDSVSRWRLYPASEIERLKRERAERAERKRRVEAMKRSLAQAS